MQGNSTGGEASRPAGRGGRPAFARILRGGDRSRASAGPGLLHPRIGGCGGLPSVARAALLRASLRSGASEGILRWAVASLQRAKDGAGDRVRTGDVHLGKVAFYR